MQIQYNASIEDSAILKNLHRLINQTYKLLPTREEGLDWEKPLETIIEEFCGMDEVLIGQHDILFPLICKLKGLLSLNKEEDFLLYRRITFECLSLINQLKEQCKIQVIQI